MTKLNIFKRRGLALGGAALLLTLIPGGAADVHQLAARSDTNRPIQKLGADPCAGRSLAIEGQFETAVQFLPPFPSFPPEPFQPLLHMLITAHGNLSHFGKTTAATTDQAVDVSVTPNKGTGHWVFQNTKGDALWTEEDLTSAPLDAQGRTTFSGILTVVGGSGKFAGATGTLLGEGFAQGTSGSFSITGTVCVEDSDDDE